jgi:low affinity Fe/Cu permease
MKKKIIEIVVAVLTVLLGILLGKLLDWSYFELSREFSIIDALSLVTTIIIAIYITTILEKDVRDKNTKKDLFVNEISAVESTLRSIDTLFDENNISYDKVSGRISTCINRTNTLFLKINSILVRAGNPKVEAFTQLISDQLSLLNQLLTENTSDSTEQSDIILQGGIIRYSPEIIGKIRKAIDVVGGTLFELKVWINDL